MTIAITTKSGSRYEIREREGKTFIAKGALFEAEIVKLKRPLQLGGIFEADLRQYNMYCQPQKEISYLRTTQIVKLDVII